MKDFNEVLRTIPADSWFHSYMEAWSPTEPPRSYLLFSGMAMLGAVLGRRVHFNLDVHQVYPLINLLLIGPSGIGKSTALRNIACDNLIAPLPEGPTKPMVFSGKMTKEALHQDLMENPHAVILASELANMFSKEKYNEGLLVYVTDLLDLAPARIRTKGGGSLVVERPECCIVGGSTKEWLQDMMPSTSAEGGFLPRFLILKEDHKYQRIPDPGRFLTEPQKKRLAILRDQVLAEFLHITQAADGKFDFEGYEASDYYGYWYQTLVPDTGALSPFSARAGAHVLRLALLVAISRFQTCIAIEDVRAGIALYNYTQRKLAEVVIPMSPSGKLMSKLIDAIGNEERSGTALRRAMRNHCGGRDVDNMLADLVRNKEVIQDGESYRRASV